MISIPDRQTARLLIDAAVTAGARRAKACAELEISDRTLRRWTKGGAVQPDQRPLAPRPEPANKLRDEERATILSLCNSEAFASLPPSQIVREAGRSGPVSGLGGQLLPHLARRGSTASPGSGQAAGPAQTTRQLQGARALRGLDMGVRRGPATPGSNCPGDSLKRRTLEARAGPWHVLLPLPDRGHLQPEALRALHRSKQPTGLFRPGKPDRSASVGREVHERESADLAAVLIRQAVLAEGCIGNPLVLHADNGSPMKGATMKTTMEKPGITASCSRPRVSNDNPFSEALFRTCKYRPSWPNKGFATRADAQDWVKSFATWYNGEHLHSAIRFVTPNARHEGRDHATRASRASLHANARAQNPHRWSGKTRNWQPAGPVWLNPETETGAPEIRDAA